MSINTTMINVGSRFNAMSLRERAMISLALLALLILVWDQFLMNPLRARRQALVQEIEEVQKELAMLTATIEGRANDNPLALAMGQKKSLVESIAAVDAQLQSTSAGLIAPPRMLEALRDVLNEQQGLRLVSMRNLPVVSLMTLSSARAGETHVDAAKIETPPLAKSGPYVHSLELIVEGNYLDVLRYLQTVEGLPWRFYWQVLELKTTDYPINRVRIRLNTLSMDKEWLGV
jgi:MSHA biogenesis protein MshJ